MNTNHLFDLAALDRSGLDTPRQYLRALADEYGTDTRLGDLLLMATEAELADTREDAHAWSNVAEDVASMLAEAEGLARKSPEHVERWSELTSDRYHAVLEENNARAAAV